ncbi:MAG: B12-binding domain-containing radical SAM protein [Magnetococcales bacterium]|nr:B12-binding domain-containing radical SAM protein [Magnetococcales bacterium]
MRVLFLYPNVQGPRTPQLGVLTLASHLLEAGGEAAVCDLTFVPAERALDHLLGDVERFKPDVLAVSCRTMEFSHVRRLLPEVRKVHPHLLLTAGGPHPTHAPEAVARLVDFVVLGDGEGAMLDIARAVADGRRGDLEQTPNLAFWRGEEFVRHPLRPLFDLEESPRPHYELFDERHYRQHCFLSLVPGAKVCGVFEASRGCPYQCTYCSSPALMALNRGGGRWRREKSGAKLKGEIDHFRSLYGLDMIYFVDEVMMTSDRRVEELRQTLEPERVPFVFMERPELIQPQRAAAMKAAGAYSCSIGIESGDEAFRAQLLGRKMPDSRIRDGYRVMQALGIKTHAFIMMGLPDQTPEVMATTFRMLREIQPDSAQATTFFPLPGTLLDQQVRARGLFSGGEAPRHYYGDSELAFSPELKATIRGYTAMINLGLWKKSWILAGLAWLCRRVPGFADWLSRPGPSYYLARFRELGAWRAIQSKWV